MKRLSSALATVLPDVTSLGGDNRNVDRERFVAVLDGLTSELKRSYWLRAFVTALVLLVLMAAIWRFGTEPPLLGIALAGMLVSLIGALSALQQVTAELARTRMLQAMAPDLSLEALTEVARRVATAVG